MASFPPRSVNVDTPEKPPLSDPGLRRELIAALRELADPGFRERSRDGGQTADDCLVNGFRPPLAILDGGAMDDPRAMVGVAFHDAREAVAVEAVLVAVAELFRDVGERMACNRPIVRSRRWHDVAAAAADALRLVDV